MAKNGNHFSESHFEKKLNNLKDTQESIQGLSAWCLSHKSDLHHIIKCWLKAIKKGKPEQCLTLFYLANDVIQYSKKKSLLDLVSAWEVALKEATPYAREEKVRSRVQRIFKIWEERDVYSTSFVHELSILLEDPVEIEEKSSVALSSDFETSHLVEKIHQCRTLEEDTDLKQRTLNESKVKITEVDALRASVKERRKTDDFFNEFDASVGRMEEYVKALEVETCERASLLSLLEQADLFYEAQRGEFKVVFTAYKQFGSRVKGVKRKVEEMMHTLPKTSETNRALSDTADAPSPTSSVGSDLVLPDPHVTPSGAGGNYRKPQESRKSLGMDLDSRITSFLAGGSQALAGSFLASPVKADSPLVPQSKPVLPASDPFPFYPGVNSPFGDLASLLIAPPPPPPPPPLMPPPVFQDLPKPEPPPPPPVSLLGQEPWSNSSPVHHPLPSRIPSWSMDESLSDNGNNNITIHHPSAFFPSHDLDLRSGQRPIDHRNLISLTSGPDKYSPPPISDTHSHVEPSVGEEEISSWLKDVLKAQEARERKPSDLNEQVLNLLDSFDHDKSNCVKLRDGPMAEGAPSGAKKIMSLVDSHHLYSSHNSRIPTSNASFVCVEQPRKEIPVVKADPPAKVPSLMATVLYPDRSSFSTAASDGSANRHQPFDQQSPHGRNNSSATASSSPNPSSRGFTPSRFSRPPYPRGSRW